MERRAPALPVVCATRKYAHREASHGVDSIWHWLAVAQHHGLPTRLIDWTYSRDTFVAFIEPPSLDIRILNQFALFSMMSGPAASLDDWVRAHPELCRRVVVPAELKWEVRDKLDQANINERTLFPGLDGLSQWLTRYYVAVRARSTA